ncbi:MAG TPA: tRNA (adenosine(37)-N6)-dimethylallyltransferase MiaA [Dissulfurispiraceae bacterium]|nr:tRNA (adenosine(37)-N6)-dimethylallyltransferase MiaA [Dissulfurispiraceae bacterium]
MKKALILLGPTGVGKTAVSLKLAQHFRTEIISSDSMQIYRQMDIGTAKPTPAEQQLVRHHMIDIVDPWEHFSAGAYIEAVKPVMERLRDEKRMPLIVGGTGLYLKAMTRGIFKGPSANPALRAELQDLEQSRPGSLYRRLQVLDPTGASKIMPNDLRRIIRAIEVCLSGTISMSDMQMMNTERLPYDFIKIGLARNRDEIYRMIERRVDVMLEQGLIAEARNVLDLISAHRPSAFPDSRASVLSSLQAIGYKELVGFFAGTCKLEDAVSLIKQRSRNYAKRQFTWFRQESDIAWIDITGLFDPEAVFTKVLAAVQNRMD